jgi:hypothetical protein
MKAKSEYKNKVEGMFQSKKMKDAWKGPKTLTGQRKSEESSSLISTPGSCK